MAFPTAIVEIAFDDGPYVLNPTWTDVTSYVWEMSVDRGRSDDWSDFDSFASVTLNNRTRRFDPYYTAGPYYGKLLPRKQIRIRATYGATTYDLFRGFIDGWNPEWTDAGTNSSVTVSCFDALQLLSSEQLPADWSRPYILSLSPRHYYPCDEPVTAFTAGTLQDYGSFPLNITLTTDASNGYELAPGLPSRSVQGGGTSGAGSTILSAGVASNVFTVSLWGVFDEPNSITGGFGNCGFGVGFNQTTGKYVVQIDDVASGLTRTFTSNETFDSGTPRFFAFQFDPTSKAFGFFIDGVSVATTAATAGAILINAESVILGNGQFQQVCVFPSLLSLTQIQNIYYYSVANFPETTSARFNRIIAESPFPSSLTSAPASPANRVLDITNDAPRIADELRVTAASEGGPLFVSKNGTVTMYSQNQQFTQTRSIVSQMTYGSGGSKLDPTIQITADGDSMRNTVYVTMSGGGVYEQTNATSAAAYGVASTSLDTQVQTLTNAQSLANITTGFGGNIYPKLSPAKVVLSPDNDWSGTLGLELMDRITVNVAPPTGNTISTPMLVQRIRHDVVPGLWTTTLDGSARWAAVFIVGQSLIGGTDLLA